MLTTEDRIITAVNVGDGAYVDGKEFDELIRINKRKWRNHRRSLWK